MTDTVCPYTLWDFLHTWLAWMVSSTIALLFIMMCIGGIVIYNQFLGKKLVK